MEEVALKDPEVREKAMKMARGAAKDVNLLHTSLTFELGLHVSKASCRELIGLVAEDTRLDETASAPNSIDHIERLANQGLYTEMKRLVEKQQYYIDFMEDMETDVEYILPGETEPIDFYKLEGRLSVIGAHIAALRKDLVSARKVEEGSGGVTINLGTMVSEAVSRMNEVDVKTIDG